MLLQFFHCMGLPLRNLLLYFAPPPKNPRIVFKKSMSDRSSECGGWSSALKTVRLILAHAVFGCLYWKLSLIHWSSWNAVLLLNIGRNLRLGTKKFDQKVWVPLVYSLLYKKIIISSCLWYIQVSGYTGIPSMYDCMLPVLYLYYCAIYHCAQTTVFITSFALMSLHWVSCVLYLSFACLYPIC